MLNASAVVVSVLGARLMACACGRCMLITRKAQSILNQYITKIMNCLSYSRGWPDAAAVWAHLLHHVICLNGLGKPPCGQGLAIVRQGSVPLKI